MKTAIKEYGGKILGYLETMPNGDVVARDFYNKELGRYIKSMNVTKDFYGKPLYQGDVVVALIVRNTK